MRSEKYDTIICYALFQTDVVGGSLSADVSNAINRVTQTSRGLPVCEEKQDRLVLFYGLRRDVKTNLIMCAWCK